MPRGYPKAKQQPAPEQEAPTSQPQVPATPAPEQAAKKEERASPAKHVLYDSVGDERTPFDILVSGEWVRGVWNADRTKLTFHVPAEHAERFALHHHVVTGRIKRRD